MARMAVMAVKAMRATVIAMVRTKKMKAATIHIVAAPGLLFFKPTLYYETTNYCL